VTHFTLTEPDVPLDLLETVAPTIHSYDRRRYDFAGTVASVLTVARLDQLGSERTYGRFTRATDQSTDFHARFYAGFERIRPLYHRFVNEVVAEVIGEPFCFQQVPTFRVHLPGNVAVGEFHADADYNHPVGELNFWVPLTRAWGSNTVWIETWYGLDDCTPIPALGPGQYLTFDAVRWRHGNVANETGLSRASFDFRCIPMSRYQPSNGCSVNTNQRFVIGDYFEGPIFPAAASAR
jgi:hypothetical protein